MQLFRDRMQAGQCLAQALLKYQGNPNGLVLGLPRGGVPVAFEVAKKLALPLDILIVRKLGVPGQEELALGAMAEDGSVFLNQDIIQGLSISQETIDEIKTLKQKELEQRKQLYRKKYPMISIEGKTVILVDDGLATGASMEAAVIALKKFKPAYIIIATPVASLSAYLKFEKEVDEVICLNLPEPFYSVGSHYRDFSQTTDEEVLSLLQQAH